MLTNSPIIAFLATIDAIKSREFYEKKIGLRFVNENEFAIVFEVNDVEIRIQKVISFIPQGHTVLGWQVPSIVKTVQELTSRGVSFKKFDGLEQSEWGIWSSPFGAKIAWFTDPDGNILSITQQ